MADLPQIASSTRDSIGRYFSLVSAVPSAILVAWTVLLIGSGAWHGRPDIAAAIGAFAQLGLGGAAGLVLTTIALGVVMHPLQFAFVQLLEGYWGASSLAMRARRSRSAQHWSRIRELRNARAALATQITLKESELAQADLPRRRALINEIAELTADQGELHRVTADYPLTQDGFMPTRLGNVLRRYEWAVGKVYGIEPITTTPYLAAVASGPELEYLNDQRSQLDLAVRMTLVSAIATVLSVLFLARHGMWLLVALIPYSATYLTYRGAIVAAAEYGRALGVVITLSRFALYERLMLEPPADTRTERRQNRKLMHFLQHTDRTSVSLTYRNPAPPATDETAQR